MKILHDKVVLIIVLFSLCMLHLELEAQDTTRYITFMGFVTDNGNKPVPGAVLRDVTKNKAVATELNGRFLMVTAPGDVISISYIGYKSVKFTIPVSLIDNKYVKNIILLTDTFLLGTVNVKAYPTAEEMFNADLNLREISEFAGFVKLNHAPVIKAPNPILSPISAISNAVQKKKMKGSKGNIDAFHQSMMIKDFYQDGASAVPDSVMNSYNK